MNSKQKAKASKNPNTSPEILEQLANDAAHWIRCRVAQNPNISIKTLELLATDDRPEVRHYVLLNPNKTQIIERLVFMTNYNESTKFKTRYYPGPVDE
jgi:hypothetical protein